MKLQQKKKKTTEISACKCEKSLLLILHSSVDKSKWTCIYSRKNDGKFRINKFK